MADLVVTGLDELLANLRECPERVQKTVLRKAVRAGTRPMLRALRALTPRDTGQLLKSEGVRIKTYRSSGTAVGIVGPRRGFQAVDLRDKHGKRATRNPSLTVHLVEEGTAQRTTKHRNAKLAKTKAQAFSSGATKATHFTRKAVEAARAESISVMSAKLVEGIQQAWSGPVAGDGGDES